MPGVDLDDQTEGNSGQLVDLLKKKIQNIGKSYNRICDPGVQWTGAKRATKSWLHGSPH